MRLTHRFILCSMILLFFSSDLFAQGKEDDFGSFILGLDIGQFEFKEQDGLRTAYASTDNEGIDQTAYVSIFAELALSAGFGVGYRSIAAGTSRETVDSSQVVGSKNTREITVRAQFPTIQIFPFKNKEKTVKLGLVAGKGKGTYSMETKSQSPDSIVVTDSLVSANGDVTYWGIFFSFQGENWGGRVGQYTLETDFEDLTVGGTTYKIDGSGTASSFSIFMLF